LSRWSPTCKQKISEGKKSSKMSSFKQGDQIAPLGDCLIMEVFLKLTEVAHIFGTLFAWLRFCLDLDKKMVGLHFRRFFHKRIWSPWLYISQRPELAFRQFFAAEFLNNVEKNGTRKTKVFEMKTWFCVFSHWRVVLESSVFIRVTTWVCEKICNVLIEPL
jgi:hypothetical protein